MVKIWHTLIPLKSPSLNCTFRSPVPSRFDTVPTQPALSSSPVSKSEAVSGSWAGSGAQGRAELVLYQAES